MNHSTHSTSPSFELMAALVFSYWPRATLAHRSRVADSWSRESKLVWGVVELLEDPGRTNVQNPGRKNITDTHWNKTRPGVCPRSTCHQASKLLKRHGLCFLVDLLQHWGQSPRVLCFKTTQSYMNYPVLYGFEPYHVLHRTEMMDDLLSTYNQHITNPSQ